VAHVDFLNVISKSVPKRANETFSVKNLHDLILVVSGFHRSANGDGGKVNAEALRLGFGGKVWIDGLMQALRLHIVESATAFVQDLLRKASLKTFFDCISNPAGQNESFTTEELQDWGQAVPNIGSEATLESSTLEVREFLHPL
jgi:hypothetical protein